MLQQGQAPGPLQFLDFWRRLPEAFQFMPDLVAQRLLFFRRTPGIDTPAAHTGG